MTPFDAIQKALGGCILHQRYYDQRHYVEARTPGLVTARLMERDPEFAEAVRALRSADLGPNVIRRDDPALGGFGTSSSHADDLKKATPALDQFLCSLRRGQCKHAVK